MSEEKWAMPEWMEKYCKNILTYDKETVELLMNNNSTVQINAPLALIAVGLKSEVSVLVKMREKGLLK